MKFLPVILTIFVASVVAQDGCGFPDGPDCESVGVGDNGLEQFVDPDGCCLLPARCGNVAGELCERVGDSSKRSGPGQAEGTTNVKASRKGRRNLAERFTNLHH
ncbi:hypothetical protein ACJ41O_010008 [Fusarium nematophilum]